jgi:hypothetical protein
MKMEYSVFKVEEKKDGRRNLFGTGRFISILALFSQNVFIFSFQEYGNIVENFFSFNLSLSLFVCVLCWRLKCSLSKHEIIY